MFGRMSVTPIADLKETSEDIGGSLDAAAARLLALTEHAVIHKWLQFPKALLVFLAVPGDGESGAFYIYDRRSRIWFWVDFEDEKFGGYSVSDFDRLLRECKFLDIVERPYLLCRLGHWVIQPGVRPQLISHDMSAVKGTPA